MALDFEINYGYAVMFDSPERSSREGFHMFGGGL